MVLLGVISPLRLSALVKKEKPLLVCCIYQSEDEWLPWVCCQELDSLLVELRSLGVVFRARKSVRLRSDLEALLFDELLGFIGSALLVANVSDPRVSRLVEGLGSCVMSGLRAKTGGPCVDEFLMMKHSRINFRNKRISFYRQPDLLLERPVVLIGSGPSLDQSLPVLKPLRDRCILVAAGSSVGSLLRAEIRPHFHVHLERGYMGEVKRIYNDFLGKLDLDDFDDVVGVMPTSIDPQLPALYRHVLLYSRLGQSPVIAWPFLRESSLRYEGPECLSAAFSFAIHLSPKSLFMFGCDLGTSSSDSLRSQGAVDRTPRRFNLRVPGNLTPAVFSNSQMMLQASYMNAAYSVCDNKPDILNFSDGMRLPFARAVPLVDLPAVQSVSSASDDFFDGLLCKLSAPRVNFADSALDESVIVAGRQWISRWIDMARRAETVSVALLRLQASRLLAERNSRQYEFVFRLFRGTLRDGFWLTAFAVENLSQTPEEVANCWSAFCRFLEALVLELEALPSWLNSEP